MSDSAGQPPDVPALRPGPPAKRPGRSPLLLPAICGLGISAVVTQLVLMRELLCVLAGNEMTFGIILGNWFLLMGLGAMLGRTAGRLKDPVRALLVAQVLTALLPVGCAAALRALRNVVFLRGAEVGPAQGIVATLVVLAPYCLVAGYVLTLACTLLSERNDAAGIGRTYWLDVLGDILGGLLFTFVLVHVMGHFAALYVVGGVNLALALAVAVAYRRAAAAVGVATFGAALAALAGLADLGRRATAWEYAGQDVRYDKSSPYGRLVVTRSAGQLNFIENGLFLFSTGQPKAAEETAHYAMAQRPDARRVLLIGGGISGTAREVLKYPVRQVDYVELDPLILKAADELVPETLADKRLAVHTEDGRAFLRGEVGPYDVIILDVPDPTTSQINRLYTAEFFRQVRRAMAPQGVAEVSLGGYANYVSPELAALLGTAYSTLKDKEAFANVLVLPGQRVFLLASDGELTADVAGRIEKAGVPTQYVTRGFLVDTLSPARVAELNAAAAAGGPVNRDFTPVLYYRHLRYWISQYDVRLAVPAVLAAAALAIYVVRLRPAGLAIFTTGFAASTAEVVILMGFQVVHGSVYHKVGLIITVFMAGLAAGGALATRRLGRLGGRHLAGLAWAVAACAALLPAAMIGLDRLASGGGAWLSANLGFPLATAAVAVLVGMEFPLAAKVDFQAAATTASTLYGADYLGSCAGALLVSTLLIPLVGVYAVCALAAGVNILSGLVLWRARA